jgi:crotonobetainyl-CoA:carnitine CoA-transferase CaiB-like acyl-CoA transferase
MTPLPLEGVRVLDFCVVWAGPFGTMLLGDLGAEVIKVENPFVMQPMTRGARAHPDPASIQAPAPAGAWPNNDLGPRPWNYTTTFVNVYRNKKSVTMDLRRTTPPRRCPSWASPTTGCARFATTSSC